MDNLRITLFGFPKIAKNGEIVYPGRRLVVALAAYLAGHDTPQSRETLAAIFWPEKSDKIARAELRRTISALRGYIGPGFMDVTRSTVVVGPPVSVDVREFQYLLKSTIPHCRAMGPVPPECIEPLERAVELYQGDFLSGFSITGSPAFDDWMMYETQLHRDSLNTMLELLSRPVRAETVSRKAGPLEYAHRWLMLDNLNEAVHRRLMFLYALAGQRGAALKQYAECQRILSEELDESPSQETTELKQRIETGKLGTTPFSTYENELGWDKTEKHDISESHEAQLSKRAAGGSGGAGSRVSRASRDHRTRLRKWTPAIAAFLIAAGTLGLGLSLFSGEHSHEIQIAVLPFVEYSSDLGSKWFVDGITEAITTELARISALRVTSRSSMEVLAQKKSSVPDIQRQLGVDYVVEGSVLKDEGRVRIAAQLIDARSDHHIWADTYESELTNIIGLQGRIAGDIATEVSARLTTNEKTALRQSRPVVPEAYEAYLLGAYQFTMLPFDIAIAPKCLENLERSIRLDESYAPAHSALANYYWGATQFGLYTNKEGMRHARAAAEHAVVLDPKLSEARTVLGFIRFLYDYNWKRSERDFKRAISLKPSSAEAHRWYGSLLCTMGRFDEAITEVTIARDLDPLSLINILNVAMRLYYARAYDAAIDQAEIACEMESGFYMSHMVLGYALAAAGLFDESINALETSANLAGDAAMEPLAVLSYVYNKAGRPAEAEGAGRKLDFLEAKGLSLSPLLRAYVPLGSGDYDSAMDLLEQAYVERDLNLAWNFQDPFFDPLRSLPRFRQLKQQMNL